MSQVVYVPAPHADPLRTVPFVAPMPHPMFFPPQDHQLHAKLVAQIDYYFRYFIVVAIFFNVICYYHLPLPFIIVS